MNDTHIGGTVGTEDLIHRLKMDAILWQMRLDLSRTLDAFAARVGVTRR